MSEILRIPLKHQISPSNSLDELLDFLSTDEEKEKEKENESIVTQKKTTTVESPPKISNKQLIRDSSLIPKVSIPEEKLSTEEATRRAKMGTTFLRISRQFSVVKPRYFEMTEDETALVWYSDRKSLERTTVLFSDISAVILGQFEPNFKSLSKFFQTDPMKKRTFTIEV